MLTGKELTLGLFDSQFILLVIGVVGATSLVAGFYPAFIISEFQPVNVLKGQLVSGSSAFLFRRILVITQFLFSILGIISTGVVFRQMSFMQNRDIGFVRDNLF